MSSNKVEVVVRVRPLSDEELEQHYEECVEVVDNSIIRIKPINGGEELPYERCRTPRTPAKLPANTPSKIIRTPVRTPRASVRYVPYRTPSRPSQKKMYRFDRAFEPNATQEDVFSTVAPLIGSVMEGYNATVFAYGATASGKTHTIMGSKQQPGIIPRAIQHVFDMIEEAPEKLFVVRLTYVELYNNEFKDLIEAGLENNTHKKMLPCDRKSKVEIHESKANGVFLTGGETLNMHVKSASEALSFVRKGASARAVGSTNLNAASSRSHTVLTLYVESKHERLGGVSVGKLHLIDLAGSERVNESGAEGDTLVETRNINASLTALGNVLNCLSSRTDTDWVVPYRNSKLTHLLKDSLGGNSLTLMIANIRATAFHRHESLLTLSYAARAKNIKNSATANNDLASNTEISQLYEELIEVKRRLAERSTEFQHLQMECYADKEEKQQLHNRINEISRENEQARKDLEARLENVIHTHQGTIAELRYALGALQSELLEQQRNAQQMQLKLMVEQDVADELREQLESTSDLKNLASAKLQALANRLKEDHTQRAALLKLVQTEHTKALREMEEQLVSEQNKNKILTERMTGLESTLKREFSGDVAELITRLQHEQSVQQRMNARCEEMEKVDKLLREKLKQKEQTEQQLLKQVSDLTKSLQKQTQENVKLRSQLTDSMSQLSQNADLTDELKEITGVSSLFEAESTIQNALNLLNAEPPSDEVPLPVAPIAAITFEPIQLSLPVESADVSATTAATVQLVLPTLNSKSKSKATAGAEKPKQPKKKSKNEKETNHVEAEEEEEEEEAEREVKEKKTNKKTMKKTSKPTDEVVDQSDIDFENLANRVARKTAKRGLLTLDNESTFKTGFAGVDLEPTVEPRASKKTKISTVEEPVELETKRKTVSAVKSVEVTMPLPLPTVGKENMVVSSSSSSSSSSSNKASKDVSSFVPPRPSALGVSSKQNNAVSSSSTDASMAVKKRKLFTPASMPTIFDDMSASSSSDTKKVNKNPLLQSLFGQSIKIQVPKLKSQTSVTPLSLVR